MSKYNLVADVSAYQPHQIEFFRKLKRQGVRAVIIKLTQGDANGDAYVNPKFDAQFNNARKAGLQVHAYHYVPLRSVHFSARRRERSPLVHSESRQANSAAVIDLEDPTIPKYCLNEGLHKFLYYVSNHSYQKNDIYCMASWIWNHYVSGVFLRNHNMWIARYSRVTQPGVSHTGTWQYTDNFKGMNVDMSYDFNNFYTGGKAEPYVPNKD